MDVGNGEWLWIQTATGTFAWAVDPMALEVERVPIGTLTNYWLGQFQTD
jgi:hypothetical protein